MEESNPQPDMSAARRLELTIFMAGMSPREWERWMETGGWMPNMEDVIQCKLDAIAKREQKRQRIIDAEQEQIRSHRRKRKSVNDKASAKRRKLKGVFAPSPAWKILPKKRTA